MYDPCAPNSRLGIVHALFKKEFPRRSGVDGLHFHAMCEQNADVLERVLKSFEKLYGKYIEGPEMGEFRRWSPHNQRRLQQRASDHAY